MALARWQSSGVVWGLARTHARSKHKEGSMNRRSILVASAIAALGFALAAGDAAAQSAKDLVGTRTLVSAEAFGANPKGVLMFYANGHFAARLARSDLPK